jgi:hypothetical protein
MGKWLRFRIPYKIKKNKHWNLQIYCFDISKTLPIYHMGNNLLSVPESVTSAIKIKVETFIKLQPEKIANSM